MIIDFQSSGGGGGGKVEIVLNATENGTYTPNEGFVYKKAVVNVPLKPEVGLSVTENGTYTPEEGKVYSGVTVNVPTYDNCLKLEISGDTLYGEYVNIAKVTKVIIPTGLKSLPEQFFANCEDLETVIVNDGLEEIPKMFAAYCENLQLLDFPSTVTTVNNLAFYYLSGNPDVILRATVPPTAGVDALCENIGALYVPDESVEAYKIAHFWQQIADRIYPLSDYPSA